MIIFLENHASQNLHIVEAPFHLGLVVAGKSLAIDWLHASYYIFWGLALANEVLEFLILLVLPYADKGSQVFLILWIWKGITQQVFLLNWGLNQFTLIFNE